MTVAHTPFVNARYWTAILLASVFGTNLGDFYAHESGLGIVSGLGVLAVLAAAVFVVERIDGRAHEIYYWLVIILIRTGATNIADYLAFRVKVPALVLVGSLLVLLGAFGWRTQRSRAYVGAHRGLPPTGTAYWLAMLTAGVFGTVVGDICSDAVGQGVASLVLLAILLLVLMLRRGQRSYMVGLYWATVAVARTAGTSVGDWLAENKILHIGLAYSTSITGVAFVAVLVLWRRQREPASAAGSAVEL